MGKIKNIVAVSPDEEGTHIVLTLEGPDDLVVPIELPHNLIGELVSKLAAANSDSAIARSKSGAAPLGPESSTGQSLQGWDVLVNNQTGLGRLRLKMTTLNYEVELNQEDAIKMAQSLREMAEAIGSAPPRKPN